MKKVLLSLIALAMLSVPAMAAEETAITSAIDEAIKAERPIQGVDVEKSGLVLVIQKQPQKDTSIQYVKVSKCGLVAVITLNGKVKEAATDKDAE